MGTGWQSWAGADRCRYPGLSGRLTQFRSADGTVPQDGFGGQPQTGIRPGAGFFNPGGQNSGSSNGQTNPNFRNFQGRVGAISGLFGIIRWVVIGLNLAALVLGILSAVGLWRQKKWAAILAIILSVVLLLVNIPGLLRIFSPLLFGLNLLKVLLALAVIILLLLPAARNAYSPPKDLDLLEGLE